MEVFKYWTKQKVDQARLLGRIESFHPETAFRYPRHIFVLPEHPLRWDLEHMRKLIFSVIINHRNRSSDSLALLKFDIQEDDPDIFIRD